jgi:hypothetical protein
MQKDIYRVGLDLYDDKKLDPNENIELVMSKLWVKRAKNFVEGIAPILASEGYFTLEGQAAELKDRLTDVMDYLDGGTAKW